MDNAVALSRDCFLRRSVSSAWFRPRKVEDRGMSRIFSFILGVVCEVLLEMNLTGCSRFAIGLDGSESVVCVVRTEDLRIRLLLFIFAVANWMGA